MTAPTGWVRLFIASLVAVPLACISAAHALSSASLRNSPELALVAFPINGLASEKVAYRSFVGNITEGSGRSGEGNPETEFTGSSSSLGAGNRSADFRTLATATTDAARQAIRHEPLSPRAFAILALAEQNARQKKKIIEHASRLSRRDLVLQALVLEDRGEGGDYVGAIGTLDEILRVHPERKAEFFPILVQALGAKASVPEFARLLARPLPWRDDFLNFALTDPQALENLAAVRERIATEDKAFDRKLIAKLVDDDRISSAERVYRSAGQAGILNVSAGQLAWRSDYPPLDWKFADQPGFRAQADDSLNVLEIDVAPGNGGVIASRLLANPEHPFVLSLKQNVEPSSQSKDMRLTIACSGQSTPFFERSFSEGESSFSVEQMPSCQYLFLSIIARSWTGAEPLTGSLSPLRVAPIK